MLALTIRVFCARAVPGQINADTNTSVNRRVVFIVRGSLQAKLAVDNEFSVGAKSCLRAELSVLDRAN